MNVCILGSSGGYAFDYLLMAMKLGVVSAKVNRIITDRPCRTNEVAKKHNINSIIIKQDMSIDRDTYSDLLLNEIPKNTDIVLIGLRRLISGKILFKFKNKNKIIVSSDHDYLIRNFFLARENNLTNHFRFYISSG